MTLPPEEHRPVRLEGVPGEESVDPSDAARRLDKDADRQPLRTQGEEFENDSDVDSNADPDADPPDSLTR